MSVPPRPSTAVHPQRSLRSSTYNPVLAATRLRRDRAIAADGGGACLPGSISAAPLSRRERGREEPLSGLPAGEEQGGGGHRHDPPGKGVADAGVHGGD